MQQHNRFLKITAAILVVAFVNSSVLWAAPDLVWKVQVPESAGRISERYAPENRGVLPYAPTSENDQPVVILIQDAHSSLDAQKNIARLVDHLAGEYQTATVGLEGAIGDVDYGKLRSFPVERAKRDMSDYFLRKGYLTGPEYQAVLSSAKVSLFGVEDKTLFKKNFAAFYALEKEKENLAQFLDETGAALQFLKSKIYSRALQAFDESTANFETGKLDLVKYVDAVTKAAGKSGISIDGFRQVVEMRRASELLKKLSDDTLEKEEAALLKVLGGSPEVQFIEAKLKSGEMAHEAHVRELVNLAEKQGIGLSKFPQLRVHQQFTSAIDAMDFTAFDRELAALRTQILDALAKTDRERAFVKWSRQFSRIHKLCLLEANREQAGEFLKSDNFLNFGSLLSVIQTESKKYRLKVPKPLSAEEIRKLQNAIRDFYEAANSRDHALIDNFLAHLKSKKQTSGVLIGGGYHTEGITNYLKQKQVPYVVITPAMATAIEQFSVRDRMMGNLIPIQAPKTSYFVATLQGLAKAGIAAKDFDETLAWMFQSFARYAAVYLNNDEQLEAKLEGVLTRTQLAELKRVNHRLKNENLEVKLTALDQITDVEKRNQAFAEMISVIERAHKDESVSFSFNQLIESIVQAGIPNQPTSMQEPVVFSSSAKPELAIANRHELRFADQGKALLRQAESTPPLSELRQVSAPDTMYDSRFTNPDSNMLTTPFGVVVKVKFDEIRAMDTKTGKEKRTILERVFESELPELQGRNLAPDQITERLAARLAIKRGVLEAILQGSDSNAARMVTSLCGPQGCGTFSDPSALSRIHVKVDSESYPYVELEPGLAELMGIHPEDVEFRVSLTHEGGEAGALVQAHFKKGQKESLRGVGIDRVTVSRFDESARGGRDNFTNNSFTWGERNAAFQSANPAQTLALMWAAKEAVFKALPQIPKPNGGSINLQREIKWHQHQTKIHSDRSISVSLDSRNSVLAPQISNFVIHAEQLPWSNSEQVWVAARVMYDGRKEFRQAKTGSLKSADLTRKEIIASLRNNAKRRAILSDGEWMNRLSEKAKANPSIGESLRALENAKIAVRLIQSNRIGYKAVDDAPDSLSVDMELQATEPGFVALTLDRVTYTETLKQKLEDGYNGVVLINAGILDSPASETFKTEIGEEALDLLLAAELKNETAHSANPSFPIEPKQDFRTPAQVQQFREGMEVFSQALVPELIEEAAGVMLELEELIKASPDLLERAWKVVVDRNSILPAGITKDKVVTEKLGEGDFVGVYHILNEYGSVTIRGLNSVVIKLAQKFQSEGAAFYSPATGFTPAGIQAILNFLISEDVDFKDRVFANDESKEVYYELKLQIPADAIDLIRAHYEKTKQRPLVIESAETSKSEGSAPVSASAAAAAAAVPAPVASAAPTAPPAPKKPSFPVTRTRHNTNRISQLIVPADKADQMDAAFKSSAAGLILDLGLYQLQSRADRVKARETVKAFLAGKKASNKAISIAFGSDARDEKENLALLESINHELHTKPPIDSIVIQADDAEDVRKWDEALTRIEKAHQWDAGSIGLIVSLAPKGEARLTDILSWTPRLAAIQIDSGILPPKLNDILRIAEAHEIPVLDGATAVPPSHGSGVDAYTEESTRRHTLYSARAALGVAGRATFFTGELSLIHDAYRPTDGQIFQALEENKRYLQAKYKGEVTAQIGGRIFRRSDFDRNMKFLRRAFVSGKLDPNRRGKDLEIYDDYLHFLTAVNLDPGVDWDYKIPYHNLYDALEGLAEKYPGRYFHYIDHYENEGGKMVPVEVKLPWTELVGKVNQFARALQKQGIKKGDTVGLVVPNGLQFIIAWFAITRLGAIAVGMDEKISATRIAEQFMDIQVKAFIYQDKERAKAEEIAKLVPSLKFAITTKPDDFIADDAKNVTVQIENLEIYPYVEQLVAEGFKPADAASEQAMKEIGEIKELSKTFERLKVNWKAAEEAAGKRAHELARQVKLIKSVKQREADSVMTKLKSIYTTAGVTNFGVMQTADLKDGVPAFSFRPFLESESTEAIRGLGVSQDDVAYIQFTSGSTTKPKGAMHSHRSAMSLMFGLGEIYRSRNGDHETILAPLPFNHTYGLTSAVLLPLGIGASSIIVPDKRDGTWQLGNALALLQNPVHLMFSVPDQYRLISELLQNENQGGSRDPVKLREILGNVRWIVSRGAALEKNTRKFYEKDLGLVIDDGYGSSEHPSAISNPFEEPIEGTIGIPGPGIRVRFYAHDVNEDDEWVGPKKARLVLPSDEDAVMGIKGPNATSGYYNNPEATEKLFDPDGYVVVGDLFRVSSNGYSKFITRLGDNFKIGGEWVIPDDIERAIKSTSPDILRAAVFPILDSGTKTVRIAAIAELKPGATFDQETVISALKNMSEETRLPPREIPSAIHFTTVPTGHLSGAKISRKAAKAKFLEDLAAGKVGSSPAPTEVVAQKTERKLPEYEPVELKVWQPKETINTFPAAGSQYNGMAKDLYERYQFVRDAVEKANEVYSEIMQKDPHLSQVLEDGKIDFRDVMWGDKQHLMQGEYFVLGNMAMTIHMLILSMVAKHRGVAAKYFSGESLGEPPAFYAAGLLSFEDALELAYRNANYIRTASTALNLRMGVVENLTEKELEEVIAQFPDFDFKITIRESGKQFVISGKVDFAKPYEERFGDFQKAIEAKQGRFTASKIETASHDPRLFGESNPKIKGAWDEYMAYLDGLKMRVKPATGTLLSTIDAGEVLDTPEQLIDYIKRTKYGRINWSGAMQAAQSKFGIKHVMQFGASSQSYIPNKQKKEGVLSADTLISHASFLYQFDFLDKGKGQSVLGKSRKVTRDLIRLFAWASGDRNNFHLDDEYAAKTKYGAVIAHGTLTESLVLSSLQDLFQGYHIAKVSGVQYLQAVKVEDEVRPVFVIEEIDDENRVPQFVTLKIGAVNQFGDRLIKGTVRLELGASEIPSEARDLEHDFDRLIAEVKSDPAEPAKDFKKGDSEEFAMEITPERYNAFTHLFGKSQHNLDALMSLGFLSFASYGFAKGYILVGTELIEQRRAIRPGDKLKLKAEITSVKDEVIQFKVTAKTESGEEVFSGNVTKKRMDASQVEDAESAARAGTTERERRVREIVSHFGRPGSQQIFPADNARFWENAVRIDSRISPQVVPDTEDAVEEESKVAARADAIRNLLNSRKGTPTEKLLLLKYFWSLNQKDKQKVKSVIRNPYVRTMDDFIIAMGYEFLEGDPRSEELQGILEGLKAKLEAYLENQLYREELIFAMDEFDFGDKAIYERSNNQRTPYAAGDFLEVYGQIGDLLDGTFVPKSFLGSDIYSLDRILTAIELANGWPEGTMLMQTLLEFPEAVEDGEAFAKATPRLVALIFGLVDYIAATGGWVQNRQFQYQLFPKRRVLELAKANDIAAIDGITPELTAVATKPDVERSAAMGFNLKWLIHTAQGDAFKGVKFPAVDQERLIKRILSHQGKDQFSEGPYDLKELKDKAHNMEPILPEIPRMQRNRNPKQRAIVKIAFTESAQINQAIQAAMENHAEEVHIYGKLGTSTIIEISDTLKTARAKNVKIGYAIDLSEKMTFAAEVGAALQSELFDSLILTGHYNADDVNEIHMILDQAHSPLNLELLITTKEQVENAYKMAMVGKDGKSRVTALIHNMPEETIPGSYYEHVHKFYSDLNRPDLFNPNEMARLDQMGALLNAAYSAQVSVIYHAVPENELEVWGTHAANMGYHGMMVDGSQEGFGAALPKAVQKMSPPDQLIRESIKVIEEYYFGKLGGKGAIPFNFTYGYPKSTAGLVDEATFKIYRNILRRALELDLLDAEQKEKYQLYGLERYYLSGELVGKRIDYKEWEYVPDSNYTKVWKKKDHNVVIDVSETRPSVEMIETETMKHALQALASEDAKKRNAAASTIYLWARRSVTAEAFESLRRANQELTKLLNYPFTAVVPVDNETFETIKKNWGDQVKVNSDESILLDHPDLAYRIEIVIDPVFSEYKNERHGVLKTIREIRIFTTDLEAADQLLEEVAAQNHEFKHNLEGGINIPLSGGREVLLLLDEQTSQESNIVSPLIQSTRREALYRSVYNDESIALARSRSEFRSDRPSPFPLPVGEGWGEGRLRPAVIASEAKQSTNRKTASTPFDKLSRSDSRSELRKSTVRVDVNDRIVTIKISNPYSFPKNQLDEQTLLDLEKIVDDLQNAAEIDYAILTGEGGVFVGGGDLKAAIRFKTPEEAARYVLIAQRVFAKIENSKKWIVSVVDGPAIGAGLQLAISTHGVFTSERTYFQMPEMNLDTLPGVGALYKLPRILGVRSTLQFMLGGEKMDAQRAKEQGIVREVSADPYGAAVRFLKSLEFKKEGWRFGESAQKLDRLQEGRQATQIPPAVREWQEITDRQFRPLGEFSLVYEVGTDGSISLKQNNVNVPIQYLLDDLNKKGHGEIADLLVEAIGRSYQVTSTAAIQNFNAMAYATTVVTPKAKQSISSALAAGNRSVRATLTTIGRLLENHERYLKAMRKQMSVKAVQLYEREIELNRSILDAVREASPFGLLFIASIKDGPYMMSLFHSRKLDQILNQAEAAEAETIKRLPSIREQLEALAETDWGRRAVEESLAKPIHFTFPGRYRLIDSVLESLFLEAEFDPKAAILLDRGAGSMLTSHELYEALGGLKGGPAMVAADRVTPEEVASNQDFPLQTMVDIAEGKFSVKPFPADGSFSFRAADIGVHDFQDLAGRVAIVRDGSVLQYLTPEKIQFAVNAVFKLALSNPKGLFYQQSLTTVGRPLIFNHLVFHIGGKDRNDWRLKHVGYLSVPDKDPNPVLDSGTIQQVENSISGYFLKIFSNGRRIAEALEQKAYDEAGRVKPELASEIAKYFQLTDLERHLLEDVLRISPWTRPDEYTANYYREQRVVASHELAYSFTENKVKLEGLLQSVSEKLSKAVSEGAIREKMRPEFRKDPRSLRGIDPDGAEAIPDLRLLRFARNDNIPQPSIPNRSELRLGISQIATPGFWRDLADSALSGIFAPIFTHERREIQELRGRYREIVRKTKIEAEAERTAQASFDIFESLNQFIESAGKFGELHAEMKEAERIRAQIQAVFLKSNLFSLFDPKLMKQNPSALVDGAEEQKAGGIVEVHISARALQKQETFRKLYEEKYYPDSELDFSYEHLFRGNPNFRLVIYRDGVDAYEVEQLAAAKYAEEIKDRRFKGDSPQAYVLYQGERGLQSRTFVPDTIIDFPFLLHFLFLLGVMKGNVNAIANPELFENAGAMPEMLAVRNDVAELLKSQLRTVTNEWQLLVAA